MSAWVYILELNNGKFYIGSTSNLKRRIFDHNHGKSPYTSKFLPAKLVFKNKFADLSIATKLEQKLKSFKNRKIITNIINSQTLKMNL